MSAIVDDSEAKDREVKRLTEQMSEMNREMQNLKEMNTRLAEKGLYIIEPCNSVTLNVSSKNAYSGVKKEKDLFFNGDLKKKHEELVKTKTELEEKYNDLKKLYALRSKVKIHLNRMLNCF